MELVIERRYRGPSGSGNGGYTCGRVAALVGEPAEVTLRLPPPLDRPLRVEREGDAVRVRDGEAIVAEARPAALELDVPPAPAFDAAKRASAGSPRAAGAGTFRECFVCGPERADGDGLRLFPGPLEESDAVAAPWVPRDEVPPELAWAAIDCPGAFALEFATRAALVLGRLTAEVLRVPRAGEHCVVLGWRLGAEGRKLYAGTALYGDGGEVLARGRATWLEPR